MKKNKLRNIIRESVKELITEQQYTNCAGLTDMGYIGTYWGEIQFVTDINNGFQGANMDQHKWLEFPLVNNVYNPNGCIDSNTGGVWRKGVVFLAGGNTPVGTAMANAPNYPTSNSWDYYSIWEDFVNDLIWINTPGNTANWITGVSVTLNMSVIDVNLTVTDWNIANCPPAGPTSSGVCNSGFATAGGAACSCPPIQGCTDVNATNYNPLAVIDDGSCIIPGCTDSNAINYNPLATQDDGSCTYDVPGCTDSNATNYNPLATIDDGSCRYFDSNSLEYVCYDANCLGPIGGNIWYISYANQGYPTFPDLISCQASGCEPIQPPSNIGCADNSSTYNQSNNYGLWQAVPLTQSPGNVNAPEGCDSLNPGTPDLNDISCCEYATCLDQNANNYFYTWSGLATVIFPTSTLYDLTTGSTSTGPTIDNGNIQDCNPICGTPTCCCDYSVDSNMISGCMDPSALNYNPVSTVDDGSCEYGWRCNEGKVPGVFGCYQGNATYPGIHATQLDCDQANSAIPNGCGVADECYKCCCEPVVGGSGVTCQPGTEVYLTTSTNPCVCPSGMIDCPGTPPKPTEPISTPQPKIIEPEDPNDLPPIDKALMERFQKLANIKCKKLS